MLRRDFLSPGRLSAFLAASDSCLNESLVPVDVLSWLLSGRNTVLLDAHSTSKYNSSLMKWDVPPQSMIILCSFFTLFAVSICLISFLPSLELIVPY